MSVNRKIKTQWLLLYRYLWKRRGLWLRGAVCWAIGLGFLWVNPEQHFDQRFRLRGTQAPDKKVVIIHVDQEGWTSHQNDQRNWLRPMKEVGLINDGFFWDSQLWEKVLVKILNAQPQSIGVNFYFGNLDLKTKRTLHSSPIFMDDRVFWSAQTDNHGRISSPSLSKIFGENTGTNEVRPDDDGIVRRFHNSLSPVSHLSQRIITRVDDYDTLKKSFPANGESRLINYQGKAGSFKSYSISDLLSDQIPPGEITNKIVIIGAKNTKNHSFTTPIGPMTRSEILANMVDNLVKNRWVQRLPDWLCPILLLILLVLSVWAMSSFPQSLAMVFLFWLGMGWSAASIWIFDQFYLWIPIWSPLVQLIVTYMVFLSYQLTIRDYEKWQLEQESKYLREIEQLKNNFVSLISHDLKTPIAKIQAICDRVLTQNPGTQFAGDLVALRGESSELHRYIQTILQITRVESRDFKINKDAGDINDIIEAVVTKLTPLAKAKNISIHTQLEPMFLVEIDAILIQEVLLNLIENSIKYSDDGKPITISTKEVEDQVIVVIQDAGQGISEEDQRRIFEKFYRGQQEDSTTKGSGLGLYLVKYFVELHNGNIFVESQIGAGTKFTLILPTNDESEFIDDTLEGVSSFKELT